MVINECSSLCPALVCQSIYVDWRLPRPSAEGLMIQHKGLVRPPHEDTEEGMVIDSVLTGFLSQCFSKWLLLIMISL